MAKIETFELDRWSEPDEKHRVKHVGMADAKETFDKLNAHLKELGMLPDEYFLYDGDRYGLTGELPDFREAICHTNFGSSEGIYLDISLLYISAVQMPLHCPQHLLLRSTAAKG